MAKLKRTFIMQEKWDYLIILDACRYDYFERIYPKYLTGKLEKRLSAGSSTREWRDKNFTGKYEDVVYASANPHINSLAPTKGFYGKDCFFKVYDLWLSCWDENESTALPDVVIDETIKIVLSSQGKRVIVHFVQPHGPYINKNVGPCALIQDTPVRKSLLKQDDGEKKPLIERTIRTLKGIFYYAGIRNPYIFWKLREFLKMIPENHMDAVRRKLGDTGLKDAYEYNLHAVLTHLPRLLENLSGRIIITADHGELLGEGGWYGHPANCHKKILLEIPWLVIDKEKKIVDSKRAEHIMDSEDNDNSFDKDKEVKISERLEALGYSD